MCILSRDTVCRLEDKPTIKDNFNNLDWLQNTSDLQVILGPLDGTFPKDLMSRAQPRVWSLQPPRLPVWLLGFRSRIESCLGS